MIIKLSAFGTAHKTPCVHKVCTKCGEKYTSCCCHDYEHDIKSRDYRPIKIIKEGQCPSCIDDPKTPTKDHSCS